MLKTQEIIFLYKKYYNIKHIFLLIMMKDNIIKFIIFKHHT